MKHWHGVVLATLVAGVVLVLDIFPDTDIVLTLAKYKDRILFGIGGIFLGALVETIWLLVMDLTETKHARDEAKKAIKTLNENTTSIYARYDDLVRQLSEKIERDETIRELMDNQSAPFSREAIRSKWMYSLYRLRESYLATNYIKEIYGTEWAQAALHIQYAKRAEDVNIRKVFIFDRDDELLIFASHIERQRDIGVQVHYVMRSDIRQDAVLQKRFPSKDIPSIDFGIFDKERVLVWDLDDNRQITGGWVLFGRDHAERHERFFDELFAKAREFSSGRFVVLRIPDQQLKEFTRTVDSWADNKNRGYAGDYENMAYSLRLGGGWLTKFGSLSGTIVYGGYCGGKLIGFSLLTGSSPDDKEFYVAIRPGHLEQGFGRKLTAATISAGFDEIGLDRIHLKVRPHPGYRVKMYADLGFSRQPNTIREIIDGSDTEFFQMRLNKSEYKPRQLIGSDPKAGPSSPRSP